MCRVAAGWFQASRVPQYSDTKAHCVQVSQHILFVRSWASEVVVSHYDCPGILGNGLTQLFGFAPGKIFLQLKVADVDLPSSGITCFHREGGWAIPLPLSLVTEPDTTRNFAACV